VIARVLVVAAAALALAGPASACVHPKTSLSFLEGQIMCPTCHTTLDMSEAPAAQAIKAQIAKRVAQCWTAQQIEAELVGNFGQGILAAPPHKGFDLLAWWLPIAGVLAGATVIAAAVWRWSRVREPEPQPAEAALDPETDRRIDELLAKLD
jgi:cytochrome c-type biogenesis protein CcmH